MIRSLICDEFSARCVCVCVCLCTLPGVSPEFLKPTVIYNLSSIVKCADTALLGAIQRDILEFLYGAQTTSTDLI